MTASSEPYRVCIPVDFRPNGGGHYFLQELALYLEGMGWSVTHNARNTYDILFINAWMVSTSRILTGIRRNPDVRIVQRVDGAAIDYGRRGNADERQASVSSLADLVVFQSDYCRYSTRGKFAIIEQDGPVVHNPVDSDRFRPDGQTEDLPGKTRVACVSWSTNPYRLRNSTICSARQRLLSFCRGPRNE